MGNNKVLYSRNKNQSRWIIKMTDVTGKRVFSFKKNHIYFSLVIWNSGFFCADTAQF